MLWVYTGNGDAEHLHFVSLMLEVLALTTDHGCLVAVAVDDLGQPLLDRVFTIANLDLERSWQIK